MSNITLDPALPPPPTSLLWETRLIQSLQDPAQAAAHLEVSLEITEDDGSWIDPTEWQQLLRSMLQQVLAAHRSIGALSPADGGGGASLAEQYRAWEQFEAAIAPNGSESIYALLKLLTVLGFRLTVEPAEASPSPPQDHQSENKASQKLTLETSV